jgi:hypothetical protein
MGFFSPSSMHERSTRLVRVGERGLVGWLVGWVC